MSERLKEIKEQFNKNEWFEGYHLNFDEVQWLIDQAERFEILVEQHDKALAENQRYKQALELYENPENHDREVDYSSDSGLRKSVVDIDRGFKARQALQGGNDNE